MGAILVVMGNGLWLVHKARSETLVSEVPKGVIALESPCDHSDSEIVGWRLAFDCNAFLFQETFTR